MDKIIIREHFNKLALTYDWWKSKNKFYHNCIKTLYASIVTPGSNVLEVGCATGDLLNYVKPSYGLGIDISQKMIEIAKRKYPNLIFKVGDIDTVNLGGLNGKFDYIILSNLVDYLPDVLATFFKVKELLDTDGLIIVTTNNPLWEPILKFAGRLKLRTPDGPRNFWTNRDIANLANLSDLEVVKMGLKFFVPKWIPLISSFINFVMSEIPILRQFCLLQYLVIRPQKKRQELSCSVIIPCYNEEQNIAECINRVPKFGKFTEIIVVDDGSTDKTAQKVQDLIKTKDNLKLISYVPNKGKGNAVKNGFEAAKGDVLIILDADMSVMPEDMPKFFYSIQEGKADFINGTRMIYPMEGQAMRSLNYIGNKFFNFILSWLIEQRVTDTLCGTKAILKKDFLKINMEKCPWGDFDLLLGIAKLKKKIVEMPVHYQRRTAGRSKMRVIKHGFLLMRMCWIGFLELKLFRR